MYPYIYSTFLILKVDNIIITYNTFNYLQKNSIFFLLKPLNLFCGFIIYWLLGQKIPNLNCPLLLTFAFSLLTLILPFPSHALVSHLLFLFYYTFTSPYHQKINSKVTNFWTFIIIRMMFENFPLI